MKKILFIVSVLVIAGFSSVSAASGKNHSSSIRLRSDEWHGPAKKSMDVALVTASNRFTKNNPDAQTFAWDRLNDGSLVCHYHIGKKTGRAFYGRHGRWIVSIEDYAGPLLPTTVSADITAIFGLGTEISSVNEIIRPGLPSFYLAVIKTGPLVQRVSAGENGVEVVEKFITVAANALNEN